MEMLRVASLYSSVEVCSPGANGRNVFYYRRMSSSHHVRNLLVRQCDLDHNQLVSLHDVDYLSHLLGTSDVYKSVKFHVCIFSVSTLISLFLRPETVSTCNLSPYST